MQLTKTAIYQISFLLLAGILFLLPRASVAQEQDTTQREFELEQEESPDLLLPRFDREVSGGVMHEMGTYNVPEETQYYQPPFKGQEYLDMAVEAYRKELEKTIGPDWLWKFMKTVSPFINNQFEFGFYQIYDMTSTVDRDNPLFQSHTDDEKKQ